MLAEDAPSDYIMRQREASAQKRSIDWKYDVGFGIPFPSWVLVDFQRHWIPQVLRAERRRLSRLAANQEENDEALENAACDWEHPIQRLELAELRVLVAECMLRLNQKDREILELFYRHGQSHGDIAQRLGIGIGASRVRLLRAREQLGELLIPLCPDSPDD